MTVPIIAHRTCPLDAAENSLAGIRKAAELGADGVEIDVRRTLDGRVVLMHDWSPRRTAGLPGPVSLYPWLALRRARLRGGDERVPALTEALDALPDGMIMAIEVKDARAAAGTLRAVRARRLEERVLMWSYRMAAVRYFAREAPEIEGALLRDNTDPKGLSRLLADALACGARALSAHWDAVTTQFVAEAHDRKLRVYSMERGVESVARRVSYGLDGIVTDHPREVRAVLEARG